MMKRGAGTVLYDSVSGRLLSGFSYYSIDFGMQMLFT